MTNGNQPTPLDYETPLLKRKIYQVGTLRYTAYGLILLFVWLLWGDLVWTLMEAVIPNVLPLKLGHGQLEAEWLIPIFQSTIPAVMVFVLCPIVSFRSDRYRSRYGRRIPYLLWSTPILSIFLMLFGLSEIMGHSLYGPATHLLHLHITQNTLILVLMGVCLCGYRFGDVYANTIYWYLFNDVVPQDMLARFNSYFRVVGVVTGMFYNYFILPKSLDYFPHIFVGAGLLYLFGFMLMCFQVKEGEYPPPPENVDRRTGMFSSIKTYARECFTHRFYWYFFLMSSLFSISYLSGQSYTMLRNVDSLKLDLQTIGNLANVTAFATLIMLPFLGWLADRLNPIRVFVFMMFVMFISPVLQCIFIFKDFGTRGNTWILLGLNLFLLPFDALGDTVTMPMYMRLLPKERYGQFCSANGTLRALARIVFSLLVGPCMLLMMNFAKRFSPDPTFGYRLFPVWTVALQIPALICLVLLFREWQRLGGNESYVPPAAGFEAEAPVEVAAAADATDSRAP